MAFEMRGAKTKGREPGSISLRKMKLAERLEELGCRPEELLAKIVTKDPELVNEPHPALGLVNKLCRFIAEDGRTHPTQEEWESFVEDLREALKNHIDLEMRGRAAESLMPYLYPKLKAVELTGADDEVLAVNLVLGDPSLLPGPVAEQLLAHAAKPTPDNEESEEKDRF